MTVVQTDTSWKASVSETVDRKAGETKRGEAFDARLIELWPDTKLTATAIAVMLGLGSGGKSIIIGRVHRLIAKGLLAPRPSPIKPKTGETYKPRAQKGIPQPRQQKPTLVKATKPVFVAPTPPPPPPVIFTRRSEPCCWPIGTPKERATFRYCDAPSLPGKSYCPEHQGMAFIKREKAEPAQQVITPW